MSMSFVIRRELLNFWESIGKNKKYCVTFSVLSLSETEGYLMELVEAEPTDNNKNKNTTTISSEIFAIHSVPIKDTSVQFGLIDVPIFDLKGEIEAPWITKLPETSGIESFKIVQVDDNVDVDEDEEMEAATIQSSLIPPVKRMKTVQSVRTFMHNGYQMTEVVNELVPFADNEQEQEIEIVANAPIPITSLPLPAPPPQIPAKAKQSSMMNFFKKK